MYTDIQTINIDFVHSLSFGLIASNGTKKAQKVLLKKYSATVTKND